MTIVLDTNVLFAALTAKAGLCARLFELCMSRHSIVLSEHIITELNRHLSGKGRLTSEQVQTAIAAVVNPLVQLVTPTSVPADACRDADDLPVLGTAVAGRADVIVTGDKDLLDLHSFQGVAILSPRQLYDQLVLEGESPIA